LSGKRNNGRNAIALALSAILHVIFIVMVINESATPYNLPENFIPTVEPPVEVELVPEEKIPPPPVITPKIKEALKRQETPPPPTPQPLPTPPKPLIQLPSPAARPKPATVKPTPPAAAPPTLAPPTPARPTPPKVSPIAPTPSPTRSPAPPAPAPSPTPSPKPAVRPTPTPTAVAPVPAKIAPPAIVLRPSLLNLHKPAKEAPANVPTLPMAPSGQAGGGGGGGAPAAPGAPGGSRLSGLSPYPYGAMPSGGPGLRGTLVGCANAEAVNLSSVERARCNERFGVEATKAPVLDGIDPARRSQFDKTAQRQEEERRHGAAMPAGTDQGMLGMGGLGPN
jgi:hypothetical protein